MNDGIANVALGDDLVRLRALDSVKWSRYPADVLPCWIADMDLPTAPVVTEAVRAIVDRRDFGYSFGATDALPEAWHSWLSRRHGWSPGAEGLRLFTDVLQAVELALWAGTEPDDGVVLLTPVYPPFFRCISSAGRRAVDCPLDPGTWHIDPERLEAAVTGPIDGSGRVSAILMCNPHNPTGRAFTTEELSAVAEVARRHDLLVISDEIWADIVFPGARHIPFESLPATEGVRVVTATAASKAFNIAGLRCAVGHISDPCIEARVAALPDHLLGAVATPGAAAALAALTEGEAWLAETMRFLVEQRDHFAARVAAKLPDARMAMPEATYLAWLDLRAYGLGDDPAAWLLEHARVALNPGPDFSEHGHGFVRLNFATTRAVLDEAVERIAAALR